MSRSSMSQKARRLAVATCFVMAGMLAATGTAVSHAAQIDVSGISLNFAVANRINIVGTGGDSAGDVVKYAGVGTVGGVTIDAVVETTTLTNVQSSTISNMDSGSNYGEGTCNTARANNVNCAENFGIDMTTTGSGGSALFKFSFFESGTYSGSNTGVPVTLTNVKITSLDLDTSGGAEYQYTDFTGFGSYVVNNPTNLLVDSSAAPLIKFKQGVNGQTANNDRMDQVQVYYSSISTFSVRLGNLDAGTAYFGLLFQPVTFPDGASLTTVNNPGNAAPTAANDSKYVASGVESYLNVDLDASTSASAITDFGDYRDADGQGLASIKVTTLPTSGSLQFWNGSAWASVTLNQVISASDLDNGNLRYTSAGTNASMGFSVNDGVVSSASTYTLSFVVAQQAQTISVTGHTAPAPSVTPTVTATSGNTPALESLTTGTCTVSGSTISVAGGVTSGVCVIQITEPGNSSWSEAPVTELRINISGGNLLTVPNAATNPASSVASTSALLEGSVNPNGLATTVTFVYGTNPLLASGTTTVTATQSPLTSGSTSVAVSKSVTGLTAGTYYFRVVASSSGGTLRGVIRTFSIGAVSSTSTTVAVNSAATTTTTVSGLAASGSGAEVADVGEIRSIPESGVRVLDRLMVALLLVATGLLLLVIRRRRLA